MLRLISVAIRMSTAGAFESPAFSTPPSYYIYPHSLFECSFNQFKRAMCYIPRFRIRFLMTVTATTSGAQSATSASGASAQAPPPPQPPLKYGGEVKHSRVGPAYQATVPAVLSQHGRRAAGSAHARTQIYFPRNKEIIQNPTFDLSVFKKALYCVLFVVPVILCFG